MTQNKKNNSGIHPYAEFENTPLWDVVNNSLIELEQNRNIKIATRKEYVIGYGIGQMFGFDMEKATFFLFHKEPFLRQLIIRIMQN